MLEIRVGDYAEFSLWIDYLGCGYYRTTGLCISIINNVIYTWCIPPIPRVRSCIGPETTYSQLLEKQFKQFDFFYYEFEDRKVVKLEKPLVKF